jgi:hypothetical protein
MVSEGAETHEWWSLPQVEGVSRPKTITSVFLLPQKSHECGFIFIPCHKNYRKNTFNSGNPHAKFAMTSRWRYATTSRRPVQQYAWRHWGSRRHWRNRGNPYYTYVVSDIFGSIAGLHGSNFVFYEIYRVGDSSRCRINFARKGILVCVF